MSQSNAELKAKYADFNHIVDGRILATPQELEAFFQSQQRQLLQELLEQKKEFESRIDDVPVYLHAVPVSVIQNKLEGLS